jgi:hypothetical protein
MKIMQVVQAPQAVPKIVVESCDHEESVDLAKLQISMLQLMYAGGDIDWEEGTVKKCATGRLCARFLKSSWQICRGPGSSADKPFHDFVHQGDGQ